MGGGRFQVKTHASRQILYLGRHYFLPGAPMGMILVFLKSQCRERSKNVYFYSLLINSFCVMILSSQTYRDTPIWVNPPPQRMFSGLQGVNQLVFNECSYVLMGRWIDIYTQSQRYLDPNTDETSKWNLTVVLFCIGSLVSVPNDENIYHRSSKSVTN